MCNLPLWKFESNRVFVTLTRVDGRTVAIDASDISIIDENDDSSKVYIRHYGKLSVKESIKEILRLMGFMLANPDNQNNGK